MKSAVRCGAFVLGALLVVAPGRSAALDLNGALREVAAANPTLASRREMLEAARRRVAPAGAWASPMVELGAINVPTTGRFDMDPMTMKMVGVQQSVPVFGANRLRRQAARAAAESEGAGLDMAGVELYAMAWETYADAWFASGLAALGRGHRAEMDQLVGAARARYESGRGRLDDVLRAEAERARTLSDVAMYSAEEASARAQLAALMGRDGAALADSLEPPPAVTLPAEADSLVAALDDTHPRLREPRVAADRWRLAARAARRAAWPDLQAGVSYGVREPILGVAQDNMWTATLGFMVPVFAGQREFSEGAEMDAMARAAEQDARAARLDLDQRIRGLHASARASQRTISLLADTVLVAQRRAVEASWSAYNAGTTDLWRVFEASHALYAEEIDLVRARQELARTEGRLLAATARGDLFGLALPAPERSPR